MMKKTLALLALFWMLAAPVISTAGGIYRHSEGGEQRGGKGSPVEGGDHSPSKSTSPAVPFIPIFAPIGSNTFIIVTYSATPTLLHFFRPHTLSTGEDNVTQR